MLRAEKLMLSNCGAGEDSWESLGLQGDPTSQRNQPWIFIGRTNAEAPIFWPSGMKSQVIGKDRVAGKDWRHKEKRAAEDELVRYHHWLNGLNFEHTLGDSEGQGSLAYWYMLSHFSCVDPMDPMDCSLLDSSVRGIFQARILKWASISFSRGSSWLGDWACVSYVSCIGRQFILFYFFYH